MSGSFEQVQVTVVRSSTIKNRGVRRLTIKRNVTDGATQALKEKLWSHIVRLSVLILVSVLNCFQMRNW